MADAVEKGADLIVVPLDAVFDGRRLKVGIGIEVTPPPIPTQQMQACVPLAARGFGVPAF